MNGAPPILDACNGAVLLLLAVWVVALVLLEITESPTHEEVRK